MATTAVTLNGVTYFVPQPGEQSPTYDQDLTNYLIALATAFPQGGSSPSSTFQTLISATANPATSGSIRLAKTDGVSWRNQGNTANDNLAPNSNDDLQWFNATTSAVVQITGQPYVYAFQNTSQTGITTPTIVKYDGVAVDTDSAYSAATGQFTVPTGKGGQYLIAGVVVCGQVTSAGIQTVTVNLAGGSVYQYSTFATVAAGAGGYLQFSVVVPVTAGQTLDVRVSTAAGTISTSPSGVCRLSIKRLV